jgi:hypothetical protein
VAILTLSALLALPPHAHVPGMAADDHDEEEAHAKEGTAHGTLRQLRPYEALICTYSWPCEQALRVAQCESRWQAGALSPGGHIGLFQLAPMHARRIGATPSALFDPEINVAVAFHLWSESGWRPWACKP